jgi:hypothetical protein
MQYEEWLKTHASIEDAAKVAHDTMRMLEKALNRRVAVENEMWNCICGKHELPDKNKLKEWAIKLGVPEENTSKGGV